MAPAKVHNVYPAYNDPKLVDGIKTRFVNGTANARCGHGDDALGSDDDDDEVDGEDPHDNVEQISKKKMKTMRILSLESSMLLQTKKLNNENTVRKPK